MKTKERDVREGGSMVIDIFPETDVEMKIMEKLGKIRNGASDREVAERVRFGFYCDGKNASIVMLVDGA